MKLKEKRRLIRTVESVIPEALEGFDIHTSKQLVKNHKRLIKFVEECIEDYYDVASKEVKKIIRDTIDNWKF